MGIKPLSGIEKCLASIVGVVFSVAAVALVWILTAMFANHYAARSWVAVPAEIDSADIKNSRSSGATISQTISKVKAAYRYRFNGSEYTGSRVDFSFGGDNFGDARRARQMRNLHGDSPMVFVNPANPGESVLDRSLPIEQVNFAVIFLFFPCGLGTCMLFGWSSVLLAKAGIQWPTRFATPGLGLVHTLPAFYAPFFAPAELGPFGWLLVLVALMVLLVTIRSVWRRLQDPTIDAPQWESGRWVRPGMRFRGSGTPSP